MELGEMAFALTVIWTLIQMGEKFYGWAKKISKKMRRSKKRQKRKKSKAKSKKRGK